MNNNLEKEIIDVINTLKLYIAQDGGDLEFVKLDNYDVYIQLKGACVGCASVDITYKDGLERLLQDEIDSRLKVKLI